MNTKPKSEGAKYYEQKKEELQKLLDETIDNTFTDAEAMQKLANHFRLKGIYNYTFYNRMTLFCQGSELAQSFKNWQKLGRFVQPRGERTGKFEQLYVWVPRIIKKKETDKETGKETVEEKLIGFNIGRVWDVTDTGGKPLEYENNSETTALLASSCKKFYWRLSEAMKKDIKISVQPNGRARGYLKGDNSEIVVSESNNAVDMLKVLIHEGAHFYLGHANKNSKGHELSRPVQECEAEGVSLLISAYLCLDYDMQQAYIENWKKNTADIRKKSIFSVAHKFIKILKVEDQIQELKKENVA